MIKLFKNNALLNKLNNSTYFMEFYCLFLSVIAIVLWKYAGEYSVCAMAGVAAISIFVLNDFKYMIPCVLYAIFSFNQGLTMQSFPLYTIIGAGSLLVVLILYMILNGFHITKARSCIGIAGLAISCAIPFFWNRQIIPEDSKVLYFMYLAYFLYLVIYIVFVANLKQDSLKMTAIAFSYAAILVACQCIWKVYDLHIADPSKPILSMWYYLGWGLCNEAGIMMIMFLPATFFLLVKSKTFMQVAYNMQKLLLIPVGMLLTTSRGTLLFGVIEFILLAITSLFLAKKKWTLAISYVTIIGLCLLGIQLKVGIPEATQKIINSIFDKMSHEGTLLEIIMSALAPNGRYDLWNLSIEHWTSNNLVMILGGGVVEGFRVADLLNGGLGEVFIVYHSTLFESLACFGIVGTVFLFIHFLEKYFSLCRKDKAIMYIFGFGYMVIDIYGMVDNTYGMWYFMIPLMVIMASLDCYKSKSNRISFEVY